MPENISATIYNKEGEKAGTTDLPTSIFNRQLNALALSSVFVANQKSRRSGRAHTKFRSDVRGGGRKPWRQKGTGRARHGSTRSPIWRGGGVTHGPRSEKKYSVKVNLKLQKAVLAMAVSQKYRDEEVLVVSNLDIADGKTKTLSTTLRNILKNKPAGSILLITAESSSSISQAASNLPKVTVREARQVGVNDVLASRYLLITPEAIKKLEQRIGK